MIQSLHEVVHNTPIHFKEVHIKKSCTSEVTELKEDLRRWGETAQVLEVLRNEIKRMEKSIDELKENDISLLQKEVLLQEMQDRTDSLVKEAEKRMHLALEIDSIVSGLDAEEETFLRLRFQEKISITGIQSRMHLSRASVFRLQNKCFRRVLDILKNDGRERHGGYGKNGAGGTGQHEIRTQAH